MSHLGSLSNVNSSSVGIGNGSNGGANTGVYNIGASIGNCGGNGVILQTLKRRANKASVPLDERVTLERVYGLTSTSNSRLAQSVDGTIAYLAGCVIVLYYPGKQANNDFIISSARKTLTTVGFSIDGRYIATGESGHDPRVRVWDVKDKVQIAEFAGHKFSIECVYFSPNLNSNLLVSIGSQHDMVVNVWNIKTRFKAASNKISCKVKGMSFSRDASYFVTVGNRHVKFWYLTTSSLMETVPLKGRAAILGEYKNYYFCDVVCGSDDCAHLTYALTTNGILCEFNENRYLSRAVDLNTEYAYCLYADNFSLFVGCSNGNIHLFRQKNLDLVSCLPRPHYLGVDISQVKDTSHVIQTAHNTDLKYPDCVALAYNRHTHLVTAVYNDHSMYTWDIADLTKVKKIDSHLFHSSSCSALDIYPNNPNANKLPYNSFITCSTDNTLRIWSSVSPQSAAPNQAAMRSKLGSAGNIYSSQLLKIIYIENDLSALCDIDQSLMVNGNQWDGVDNGNNISNNISSQIQQQQVTSIPMGSINNINMLSSTTTGTGTATNGTGNSNEQTMANSSNKLGARCLKISPMGNHLATGDRNGNIKIFDLDNLDMIGTIEAHDCEILCLQYSQVECGKLLLASSSRDRLIHIFDATSSAYTPIQTIDDHSSSISALRFCFNRADQQLHLISCGNDKSIMVRTMSTTNTGGSHSSSDCSNQFQRSSYAVEKQTFYDLNVDNSNACINTISQDRMVRTYSIKDGKRVRQFRGSLNEDGHLIKMDTDRTGCLIAASCTDKCVYIWDLSTCECVGYIYGHAEVVADLKFTWDNQHLITVSGDGCVFVWRLNSLINNNNSNNNNRAIANTSTNSKQQSNSQSTHAIEAMFDQSEQLPAWAKNKLNKMDEPVEQQQQQQSARRSRAVWGPPVNDTSFAVMSESEMNSMSLNDDDNVNQIEFPSPCVDKMDTSSWPTISEDVDVDSEARLSSTVCANLTFRRNECQNGLLSSPSALHFNSDFSKILNPSPNPPRTPANRLDADSDSALRRQSLSARYLMKTAANPTQTQTPVLSAAVPRTIDECSDDAERSDSTKKKSLCTHTESSLNKTRSKSTVKRSPSVSSLSNESRSSIASCSQKSKCTSAKSSPQRLNDDGYLKKAVSMVSLDARPGNTGKKNPLAGPKTLRQIKQRATATSASSTGGGGSETAGGQQPVRPVAPATTFYEQNKHLRKLSTSIQNITNSGLSLLHAPGSNLPPQAPRTCAKSAQFELSPKKSEMLSSSSSSASSHHNNDNDEANLRESSLSSSSSSSCSIYDQAVQMDNECDIKKKLVHSLINNVGKVPYLLNRSADFCQQSNTTNVKMNSLSLNSSPIGHNFSTLKKPTTFASLAAAASHSNNIILNSSTNTTNTQTTNTTNANSLTQKPNLSSDKIESILYEFKQNMFILDLIYDQVSSNIDEYKKLQHTANLIQTTTCGQSQIASAQTLQIIQTFNTSIYSIVKQFKTMLASQSTPLNNASQSNTSQSLETNKIDTDLEYV